MASNDEQRSTTPSASTSTDASGDDDERSTTPSASTSTDASNDENSLGQQETGRARSRSRIGINDLPNDIIVSVAASLLDEREYESEWSYRNYFRLKNLTWLRETFPLVCKRWRDLFYSQQASPLHETLEIDFFKDPFLMYDDETEEEEVARSPVVRPERVIAFAERHARSVRRLHVLPDRPRAFTSENMATLVKVLAPHLEEIEVGDYVTTLVQGPFWDAIRDSVVPVGKLRKLNIDGFGVPPSEDHLASLRRLTSLEELTLEFDNDSYASPRNDVPYLTSFPALETSTNLRRLGLAVNAIPEVPRWISSLRRLEYLDVSYCDLASLPAELGALKRLTGLEVGNNDFSDAASLPAALRGLTSLRRLGLEHCRLTSFPSFIEELPSLEHLALSYNELASLPDDLCKRMPDLREIDLNGNKLTALPPRALAGATSLKKIGLARNLLTSVPVAALACAPSIEEIDLSFNDRMEVDEPLDALLESLPMLRVARMPNFFYGSWTQDSRANLQSFAAKLRARDQTTEVELVCP